MPKLAPHRLGTTEYIRLSKLPTPQASSLRDWLPETYLTKLEEGGSVAEDCIAYEDYEFWYEYSRPDEEQLDEQL
ncbi:hypothetical protein [Cesiribacter sp. SM1]|uniref:hypothetical protein n=1 Tax=Cesiribacter sp. SM1 TaxID=2861196 RepID=UPI001CD51433|nr:hypothetical protein [Cesiribacter sp. SM1]